MAVTKELDILIKANYADIDTAKLKVEQLKNATVEYGKGVKIVYDETGKAINVLTDSNQKLNRQATSLVDAMNKLALAGKQNTAEYTLLQRRHLELATTIEKTKGNSKDLFNTLSLLPGPVGKFAGEVQGAIEILKVFSGTNISSLKTQFNELADVVKSAFGFGGEKKTETGGTKENVGANNTSATKEQTEALKEQNKELEKNKENFGSNAQAVKSYTDEQKASNKIGGEHLDLVKGYGTVYLDVAKNYAKLTDAERNAMEAERKAIFTDLEKIGIDEKKLLSSKAYKNAKEGEAIIIDKTTGKIQTATEVEKLAANQTSVFSKAAKALSDSLRAVGVSAEGAALAVGVLEAALAAIGIGVVIGLLVGLYDTLKELITEEDKAALATQRFNKELDLQKKYLEFDLEAAKNNAETKLAILRKNNAEGKDIRDLEAKEIQAQLVLVYNAQQDANNKYNEALKRKQEIDKKFFGDDQKKTAAADLQKANDYLLDLQKQYNNLSQQLRVKDFDNTLQSNKEKDDLELKNLDISIKRNIEARNTDIKQLEKDLARKAEIEAYWGHYKNKQLKDIELENSRIALKARTEDIDTTIQGEIIKDQKLLITAKQGSEAYYKSKEQLARDEFDKEFNAAMTAGDKMENMILAAENNLAGKLNTLEEEKKNQKLQYQKEVTDLFVAGIRDEYAKSVAARNITFHNEKLALQRQLDDKVITQEQYNMKLKLMQNALNNDLDKLNDEHKIKELQAQKSIDESRMKLLYEGYPEYYKQQRKIEDDNYQEQKIRAKGNAKELEKVEKEHADTMIAIDRAENAGKRALLLEHLAVVGNIGANLQAIAGKNKDVAIAGIRVQQAATTATIVLSDLAAIRKAYEAAPEVFGLPWSAVYAADMITGVLAANISANNAIEAINGSGGGGAGGGSGAGGSVSVIGKNYGEGGLLEGPRHAAGGMMVNAEGGEAIMTRGAVTMFKPLLSMMNQAGGGTSFTNDAMGGGARPDAAATKEPTMEQPIIKTYVVENELTSMQHKQQRLKSLSTL